jgi:hypothetical protein
LEGDGVNIGTISGGTFNFNFPNTEERRLLVTLISEAGGTCLGVCSKRLGVPKNDAPVDYCKITYIDAAGEEPQRGYHNAVALCMECASEFPTWDDVQKANLLARKREKAKETEIMQELAKLPLKRQIKEVVRKFNAQQKGKDNNPLTYDPVEVDIKISDDALLRDTVRNYVRLYYYFVADTLEQISAEDSDFDIEEFSEQIKGLYKVAKKKLHTKEEIFERLVETLFQTCGGETKHRRVCEVIVAYYVQSCEVFDIPKEAQDEPTK